jgi:hypothetical protein
VQQLDSDRSHSCFDLTFFGDEVLQMGADRVAKMAVAQHIWGETQTDISFLGLAVLVASAWVNEIEGGAAVFILDIETPHTAFQQQRNGT